ncbi:hypothetical protein [Hahella sp. HN01]|uniref:hypothetical protein n=1 Tax=Hahella sp. HN01 TaxID=2847262 RepID=UPI001C1EED9E|nr:hypothetical protein [Hahella sp. HN01]MBU6952488.1 hypothetical protein [Hahella sp. HN01]
MNAIEFRENFREFLKNDERYKKFVAIINRGRDSRLLFWQERAIEQFCEKHALEIPSFEVLQEIFSVCELHGNTLEHGKAKVFCGHIDYSPDYIKACAKLFPNSYMSSVNGPEEM